MPDDTDFERAARPELVNAVSKAVLGVLQPHRTGLQFITLILRPVNSGTAVSIASSVCDEDLRNVLRYTVDQFDAGEVYDSGQRKIEIDNAPVH